MGQLEIFIQGSHKNNTIIHGGGDVDVIVKIESSYYWGLDQLSSHQAQLYRRHHRDAIYDERDLRADIKRALRIGQIPFEDGRKAIAVSNETKRLPFSADIIPCCEYRLYHRYKGPGEHENDYTTGIAFKTNDWQERLVVNYPKQHYDQGVSKNVQVNGTYKETIRLFKNARNKAVDMSLIEKEKAPSYFIECLLHNVPDSLYDQSVEQRYPSIIQWLYNHRNEWSTFDSQNKILPLFGTDADLWDESEAEAFVNALMILWNRWDSL